MSLMLRHSRLVVLSISLALAACDTASNQNAPVAPSQPVAPLGVAVPGEASGPYNAEIGNTVYFETNSSVLDADAQEALRKQASWLNGYPSLTFTIEGHADERGTREYNLGLGERRANAIGSYMAALGIDPARISVISYGKERPLCVEATEACWGQNRRGVTYINSN